MFVDSAGRRSRADGRKSSSGVMADVVGAVGTFCHIESPVLTSQHSVVAAPALPPRVPLHHRPPGSPSHRKSQSQSSSSVISPAAVKDSPTRLCADSLDVFIPSSADAQPCHDGAHRTVHTGNEAFADWKPSALESVESERSAVVIGLADGQEFDSNDAGDGLDVVIGTEDDDKDRKLSTLDSLVSEQKTFMFSSVSADRRNDSSNDVSGGRGQQFGRRTRLNVVCRLTRKETTKLSRKLTRKMSCRQQHALMMEAEFDEFDELDVVVEREGDNDDDDDDDELEDEQSSVVGACQEQINDGVSELNTARHSDVSDAGFDERITTRLHYDRLQVRLPVSK